MLASTVSDLRDAAYEMRVQRTAIPIELAPGHVFDLGDDGITFGSRTEKRETYCGQTLFGAGAGSIIRGGDPKRNGWYDAPTVIRYTGTGAALEFAGISYATVRDCLIHAPNGTALAFSASIERSIWATNCEVRNTTLDGSAIGIDLVGLDTVNRQGFANSQFGYGQVDNFLVERCAMRDVSVGLRQNAVNTVHTTVRGCEIKAKWIGLCMLEGTFTADANVFVDGDEALAAIYAANAMAMKITGNHFELDGTPALYARRHFEGRYSETSMIGNTVLHGKGDRPAIRFERDRGRLILDDEYGMRGVKGWRMEIAEGAELLMRRPPNPQVTIERFAATERA